MRQYINAWNGAQGYIPSKMTRWKTTEIKLCLQLPRDFMKCSKYYAYPETCKAVASYLQDMLDRKYILTGNVFERDDGIYVSVIETAYLHKQNPRIVRAGEILMRDGNDMHRVGFIKTALQATQDFNLDSKFFDSLQVKTKSFLHYLIEQGYVEPLSTHSLYINDHRELEDDYTLREENKFDAYP